MSRYGYTRYDDDYSDPWGERSGEREDRERRERWDRVQAEIDAEERHNAEQAAIRRYEREHWEAQQREIEEQEFYYREQRYWEAEREWNEFDQRADWIAEGVGLEPRT